MFIAVAVAATGNEFSWFAERYKEKVFKVNFEMATRAAAPIMRVFSDEVHG